MPMDAAAMLAVADNEDTSLCFCPVSFSVAPCHPARARPMGKQPPPEFDNLIICLPCHVNFPPCSQNSPARAPRRHVLVKEKCGHVPYDGGPWGIPGCHRHPWEKPFDVIPEPTWAVPNPQPQIGSGSQVLPLFSKIPRPWRFKQAPRCLDKPPKGMVKPPTVLTNIPKV